MKQLDLETFKTVLGEYFDKLKGKFDVANFDKALDQNNFDRDIVRRAVFKNELVENGFFRGHELSEQNRNNNLVQYLQEDLT